MYTMFKTINEWLHNRAIMVWIFDLTAIEKSVKTSELTQGKWILEISKIIGRYLQTVKKNVATPTGVC